MNMKLLSTASLALFGSVLASAQVLINEVQPNPDGGDPGTQTFELKGVAGTDFTAFLLSIETDAGSNQGLVDRLYSVSGTFDLNGLYTFDGDDLENPSFTLALVDDFSGQVGDDLDSDDDGDIDSTALTTNGVGVVYDAIGVPDGAGEPDYGTQLGGAMFAYTDPSDNSGEPLNIFRDGINNDWYAHNLDSGTNLINDLSGSMLDPNAFNKDPFATTYGEINPTVVPEPATMVALGFGAAALLRRKKRKSA